MTFITAPDSPSTICLTQAVSKAVAAFNRLTVDDQLGLLWVIYQNLGCTLTTTAPGAARLFLTQGLLHRIKQMPHTEQLQVMGDLLAGADTPITRQYRLFAENTKLAFWYQLFEWMSTGEVVSLASYYQLSPQAAKLFTKIVSLELDEQIVVVRQVVVDLGVDPLAA